MQCVRVSGKSASAAADVAGSSGNGSSSSCNYTAGGCSLNARAAVDAATDGGGGSSSSSGRTSFRSRLDTRIANGSALLRSPVHNGSSAADIESERYGHNVSPTADASSSAGNPDDSRSGVSTHSTQSAVFVGSSSVAPPRQPKGSQTELLLEAGRLAQEKAKLVVELWRVKGLHELEERHRHAIEKAAEQYQEVCRSHQEQEAAFLASPAPPLHVLLASVKLGAAAAPLAVDPVEFSAVGEKRRRPPLQPAGDAATKALAAARGLRVAGARTTDEERKVVGQICAKHKFCVRDAMPEITAKVGHINYKTACKISRLALAELTKHADSATAHPTV